MGNVVASRRYCWACNRDAKYCVCDERAEEAAAWEAWIRADEASMVDIPVMDDRAADREHDRVRDRAAERAQQLVDWERGD